MMTKILARADALMQRNRPGALTPADPEPFIPDDIPILTDSESPEEAMALEISRRIQARLAELLPSLIESAVRDYLADSARKTGNP